MSENIEQKPVAEAPQPVADQSAELAAQLELLKAKNAELIGERRKDQDRFKELQDQLAALHDSNNRQRQQKLVESGEHKKLWEEAKQTVVERDSQIAELQRHWRRTRPAPSPIRCEPRPPHRCPNTVSLLLTSSTSS